MEPGTKQILFLASDLALTGTVRQLFRTATGLPRDRYAVSVVALGSADTPIAADLRAAGVPVQSLPLRHLLDVRGMRNLRLGLAAANPDVIHAWGPDAVRAAWLGATRERRPPLVASAASYPGVGLSGWVTTRALRRAERVAVGTRAEGGRCKGLGVAAGVMTRVPPGVCPPPVGPSRDEALRSLDLPPNARIIVTAGRVESSTGMKAAIWAFDMLRYDYPDLYLLIFGRGADRAGLEAFGRAVAFDDFRVRFPGERDDLPSLLTLADVVWVPRDRGGMNLTLEAMAAGRPVVAWDTPELAEIIENGVSGYLVSRTERPELTARTHTILADPVLATKIGAAGRTRVEDRFPAARMAERYARLYEEVTA